MIGSERELQQTMRDLFHKPPHACCWKMQDSFITGVPDQLYLVRGVVTWVELKFVYPAKVSPRDGSFRTGLRAAQRIFLRDWVRAGGRAFLLIAVDAHVYLIDGARCPPVAARVDRHDLVGLASASARLERGEIHAALADTLSGRSGPGNR